MRSFDVFVPPLDVFHSFILTPSYSMGNKYTYTRMIILYKDEKYKLSLITITLLTLQCLLESFCCLHHAFFTTLFETQRFLQYLRYVRSVHSLLRLVTIVACILRFHKFSFELWEFIVQLSPVNTAYICFAVN